MLIECLLLWTCQLDVSFEPVLLLQYFFTLFFLNNAAFILIFDFTFLLQVT